MSELLGATIEILDEINLPRFTHMTGKVTAIDEHKGLHGTWGYAIVYVGVDYFRIIEKRRVI